jgi:quinol monooxygenase YgiN
MYVIVAELKVKPDQVETFGRLIDAQAKESVDLEEQCHQFDVCQAEGDRSHFLLYETYDDRAAFDKHREMAHTTRFLAEVKPMVIEMSIRRFSRRD